MVPSARGDLACRAVSPSPPLESRALLDVSRIVAGKLRLEARPIDDVGPLVEAAVDSLRPAAGAKGVRLDVRVDPGSGPIEGDRLRLEQVVWNLVSNAIKFTRPGGRVEVRCGRAGPDVRLCVSDDGQGIAKEFMPRIFDRFQLADASPTRAHGGLGLGLAIVKHVVEGHGGRIEAESPGEGRGATFTVHLPAFRAEAAGGPSGATKAAAGRRRKALAGVRVVVVEDDDDTRQLLDTVLTGCGAQVAPARDVGSALEAIERVRPDVVLSDVGLPAEDGYALARRASELPRDRGGGAALVALTAYAGPEDRARALAAGFGHHVAKPIEPEELVALVASLTRRLSNL